eukprot:CAMPEP_0170488178 /NCGR_PEP_ID=MMETSP0208-20121228/6797_1 /TAXON_ID=197538 /ORGANISM="Strombidium inclinatum, Strain S3" /LENGTH=66 /DNA_ID=CAMNT_0010762677 /DNA_START=654 /DNA_END=851 /DNA_ORIENTATION=-
MVTGIPPFYESDLSALTNLIMHGKYNGYFPEFDSNASENLQILIKSMIALKPSSRATSDDLVVDKW